MPPTHRISARHVVGKIAPVGHHCRAGHRRTKRPNDGNESRENHRLAAVFFVKLVRALQMPLAEDQRILAAVQGLPSFSADPVADLVSHDRAQGNEQQQFRNMEWPVAAKRPP